MIKYKLISKGEGVSLIELMIGLSLSSLLLTLLFQYFLFCKQQYKQMEDSLEQFLDLQLISELVVDSIKKSGFTPCGSLNQLQAIDRRNKNSPVNAITMLNRGSRITTRRMSELYTRASILTDFQLKIDDRIEFPNKSSLIISDCFYAEIHRLKQLTIVGSQALIALSEPINAVFHEPVYIGQWIEETFEYSNQHTSNQGFFYKHLHKERLSSVINQFRINYLSSQPNKVHLYLSTLLGRALNLTISMPNT